MDNSKQSKQVLLSVIGVAILVVAVVGVSFAFFNYTRTGAENSVSTGTIYFRHQESAQRINITNFFPTDEAGRTENNSSSVTITIEGGTTYERGLDYTVSLVNVTNGGNANVPITITQTVAGELVGTYTPSVDQGEQHLTLSNQAVQEIGTGHIAAATGAGVAGADANTTGTITITAGIASNVAITDTPDENETWQNHRTVMSTTDWNALATHPVSFNVRVIANETPRPAQP